MCLVATTGPKIWVTDEWLPFGVQVAWQVNRCLQGSPTIGAYLNSHKIEDHGKCRYSSWHVGHQLYL